MVACVVSKQMNEKAKKKKGESRIGSPGATYGKKNRACALACVSDHLGLLNWGSLFILPFH
jgi:hypothetical protein